MAATKNNAAHRDGYWSGSKASTLVDTYRKPVSLPDIRAFTKKKRVLGAGERARVVSWLNDFFEDWRDTPFEKEGFAVAALRSGLCLRGHGWKESNAEAEWLVSEALRNIGAKRPSYGEGQREYTLSRDLCVTCLGPLDDEDIANKRRFCSSQCSDVKRQEDFRYYDWLMKSFHMHASNKRRLQQAPMRTCGLEGCDQQFQSLKDGAQYCSLKCATSANVRIHHRECHQCQRLFKPTNSVTAGRFCSVECTNESFKGVRIYGVCECCGTSYTAGNTRGKYCSPACKKFMLRVRTNPGPRKLTPRTFDWMMHQIQLKRAA